MNRDFLRNAAFHDQLAAQYDEQLMRNPYDVLARRAFREIVARYVPASSTVLDFGCGTGLDALAYAERGCRVIAYDNSSGMVAQLDQRCRTHIESGRVTPYSMNYPSFLEDFPKWPSPNAVLTNFAVLNSIQDVGVLFDLFARRLSPPGWVIASVLNPIHWSKMKTVQWWRSALNSPQGPRILTTEPYVSYLHPEQSLRRAAKGFRLVGRANAGSLVRYDDLISGEKSEWWEPQNSTTNGRERALWHTPARRLLGHFVFLVWRRDP
jgi:SAM-dependent methyltransferase